MHVRGGVAQIVCRTQVRPAADCTQTLAAVAEGSSSLTPSSAGRRLLQGSATTPSTANVGVVVPTDGAAATATAVKAKLAAAIGSGTFARVLTGAGAYVAMSSARHWLCTKYLALDK